MDGELYFEYKWLEERVYVSYQCSTIKIQIRGNSLNDKLFERAKSQCTAKDLYCQVGKSTYIWNSEIIQEFLLRYVEEKKFKIDGNSAITQNQLFQIEKKVSYCNISLWSTSEGLYLTEDKSAVNLPTLTNDINVELDLILSDVDFKTYGLLQIIKKLSWKVHQKYCIMLNIIINDFKEDTGNFLRIENNTIIYNNNRELVVSKCQKVNNIEIKRRTTNTSK